MCHAFFALSAPVTITSIGYLLFSSNINLLTRTALCCSAIHLTMETLLVLFLHWLICWPNTWNSSLLNSPLLSESIVPGAPKIAIQCLMNASTTSSLSWTYTDAALNLVAWSVICNSRIPSTLYQLLQH